MKLWYLFEIVLSGYPVNGSFDEDFINLRDSMNKFAKEMEEIMKKQRKMGLK